MRKNKVIRVFEHDELLIDNRFLRSHWKALGFYNRNNDNAYFDLLPDGVKFRQFVGVIQANDITIEILPKIGKTADTKEEKKKWQSVLIDMLRECRWMRLHNNQKAPLRFKSNSILEAYLEIFIDECKQLLRQGLIRKYRSVDENCTALKGRVLVARNEKKNVVHKERFFTRHTIYDKNNLHNQLLWQALEIIPKLTHSARLNDEVSTLMLSFPELNRVKVSQKLFDKLTFDRKTNHYKEALQIAAMLLLNYRPDISTGRNEVLAILFDMNDLWEEYITEQIRKHLKPRWILQVQKQKTFWLKDNFSASKIIKPDIVIVNEADKALIIDTKWKLPENNIPHDNDLKQMYVYNEYWNGVSSVLLYPKLKFSDEVFYSGGHFKKDEKKKCGVAKVCVLDEANHKLDSAVGKRIIHFAAKVFANTTLPVTSHSATITY